MVFRIFNSLWHHIRYIPLLSALSVSRGRAFDRRSRALGALVGLVVRYFPIARRRVERELSNVYPDMPRSKRLSLCRDMGRNMGRTLFEIFHCAEFQTLQDRHSVSGQYSALIPLLAVVSTQSTGRININNLKFF